MQKCVKSYTNYPSHRISDDNIFFTIFFSLFIVHIQWVSYEALLSYDHVWYWIIHITIYIKKSYLRLYTNVGSKNVENFVYINID